MSPPLLLASERIGLWSSRTLSGIRGPTLFLMLEIVASATTRIVTYQKVFVCVSFIEMVFLCSPRWPDLYYVA